MGAMALLAVMVNAYVAALAGVDTPARSAAIDSLAASGDVAAVADAVYATGWRVREGLIDALERMGPDAVSALTAIARRHPKVDARRLAVHALGHAGGSAARDSLLTMLHGPDRDLAVEALGTVGDATAASAVRSLLKDERPDVRRRAALALAALDSTRAVNLLVPMLSDVHHGVRFAVADALVGIGLPVVPALVAHYAEFSSPGRFQALQVFGRLDCAASRTALRSALRDGDWALRAAAADGLGALGGAPGRVALEKAARREHHPVAMAHMTAALKRILSR